MADENPITQVYKALHTLLTTSSEFMAIRPVPKLIKYVESSRDPVKHMSGGPSMYPAVCIVPTGGIAQTHFTNSHGMLAKNFRIEAATGDKRADYLLFDIEFAIACALHDWTGVLEALTYSGDQFVKICALTQQGETENETPLNRGDGGWTCLWSGTVTMVFSQLNLIPNRGT